MLIKKIILNNFMCYANENTFEFSDGLNLIIGDTGYGKSKLFDAFYWVIHDKIFDSSKKEFVPTTTVGHEIVSDKVKYETLDELITTSVDITFYNKRTGDEYILQRKINIKKIDNNWETNSNSELNVWKREAPLKSKLITDYTDKMNIIKIILPAEIEQYMWFQGEKVDTIIDFNDQYTLTKAINALSNISRFDDYVLVASLAYEAGNKEYSKELKKHTKNKDLTDKLENEKEQLESKLKNLIDQEKLTIDNLSIAESKCNELLNKIEDAQNVKELENKIRFLNNDLEKLKLELLEEQIAYNKKLFKNKWVLKGSEHLLKEFEQKFKKYTTKKTLSESQENEAQKKLQARLPLNVPEPIYIERMLEEEWCLVCDREASKGSEPWLKIKELSDRATIKNKVLKYDFHNELNKIYHNGLALSEYIKNIDDDIRETLNRKENLGRKINNAKEEIIELENKIDFILNSSSMSLDQSINVLNEYNIQKDRAAKYNLELQKVNNDINVINKRLDIINTELNNLVKDKMPTLFSEKIKVLKDFKELAKLTRNNVFKKLINVLENEANNHYKLMTEGVKSVKGIINLEQLPNGTYIPQLKDNLGNTLRYFNTSNILIIKLAVIMAIITARKGTKTNQIYTLISDAPMSVFGEAYTLGFCKTVSKVYQQSIITSKEYFNNDKLREELLNNREINLGKVYEIIPSISEKERINRKSLYTIINKLN